MTAGSEHVGSHSDVCGVYERNDDCKKQQSGSVAWKKRKRQRSLLTIGEHGDAQPRSCDRDEGLEVGNAKGEWCEPLVGSHLHPYILLTWR